jgi:Sigma-54 interaction domain
MRASPGEAATLKPEAVNPELAELVQILHQGHPNVLIIGSPASTDDVLATIGPYLRAPLAYWSPADAADLPAGAPGTLVVHDVDACDPERQQRLLDWMDTRPGSVQVISTTRAPLFPRVKDGSFLPGLYYWLNFICVDLLAQGRDR